MYGRFRQRKGLELPGRFKERFGFATIKTNSENHAWFHAASVGEVVSIVPIIEQFLIAYPSLKILLTTTTVTGQAMAKARLGNSCLYQFMPYDTGFGCLNFLKTWQPKIAIFVESEIWPITIRNLKKKNIPIVLMNARLSPNSLKRWKKLSRFARKVFKNFDLIIAPSEPLMHDLKKLGAKHVLFKPHLKYASKALPYDENLYKKFLPHFKNRPNWVAASTHPGEEEIVLSAHQRLKQHYPNILTVIMPRHTHRATNIKNLCDQMNLSAQLYEPNICLNNTEVLIIERMGLVGLFYALSPISLVGGSLVPGIGGHNPIEPALFSNAVLWGPFVEKSQDICTTLQEGALPVTDSLNFINTVEDLLAHPEKIEAFGKMAHKIVQEQAGAIEEYTNAFQPYLSKFTN